ncbi:MAG: methyltransferase domain-containing protein [Terriglobia bacterium]
MNGPQSLAPRPIFIHALWRTGSTYIWKKFRDQSCYRAYFEPFNELLLQSRQEIEAAQPRTITTRNRHPDIASFYYAEYPFKPEGGVEYFEKYFPCEKYCLDETSSDEPLRKYVCHLISLARDNGQIPVLQFNRSLLRVGWLDHNFSPLNILLLRRPMDVWQSYLSFSGLYFPTVVSMILGQNRDRPPLKDVAEFRTVPSYVGATFENDFEYYFNFTQRNLGTLYPLFYSFYLLTCVYAAPYADCIIDMNGVSANPQTREATVQRLRELGVEISLSDCDLPRHTALDRSDQEWLAYESVARKLLRRSLPTSLLLSPGKLDEHEPLLGDYFRGVLAEFELQPRGENQMQGALAVLASDEVHHKGILLFEKGKYREALPLIEEALGKQETGERWSDWGAVQRALGNRENAERGFRKALELDPNLAVAATNLGVLLSEAELLERREAARVAPAVSASERALLDAHRRFGSALAGLRGMAQGLVMQFPQSREARFLFGDVLQAGGQPDLALAEYDKLRQNASPNQRRRIEQAIQQCQADRDYFPPEFAKRVTSGEYENGINAGAWRSYASREIQRGREIVRLVRERIPLAGRSVLDVGCGYGGTLIAFAEQAADVVGIEIDEERARTGKKRLTDLGIKAGYRRDDICKAGVERRLGTFDVIVAQDVLEHVLDPGRTIRTLSSLLRPGGVIYAQMGNKYSPDQLLADHHYGRAGITLLAREQAIDYFRLATGIDARHYGVGYWRTERYYRRMFARFGVELEHVDSFPSSNYVTFYSTSMEQVRRRAEREIYPGLRPELQQRMQRRMTAVSRYFDQVKALILQCESNPELVAKISDRLVKRICVPVWRFLGTKPASMAASSATPTQVSESDAQFDTEPVWMAASSPTEERSSQPSAVSVAAPEPSLSPEVVETTTPTTTADIQPASDRSLTGSPVSARKPILAYYGHHKCGSDWIHRIVKDVAEVAGLEVFKSDSDRAFDGDLLSYRERNPFDILSFVNADYIYIRSLATVGFHVIRDPRDIVVSAYFSHLNSHPEGTWPELRLWRNYLQSVPKDEGLMLEIEYMGRVVNRLLMWNYGEQPSILEYKFEDLIRNPLPMFTKAFEQMGIVPLVVGYEELHALILKNSFENLSGGRTPGSEDGAHHYRRGVPGDWRNHFTNQHIAYFKALYNPLLLKLGYEESNDWH